MAKIQFKNNSLWRWGESHKTLVAWSPSILSILLLLLGLLGRNCSGSTEYDFKSRKDALEAYHGYLQQVRSTKKTNTQQYIGILCQWQEISDTVFRFLAKDSVFTVYHNEANDFLSTHDSVRMEMLRLTETWKYDYTDILTIKEQSCTLMEDTLLTNAVKAAEPFFNSLDKEKISVCDKSSLLMRYRYFLQQTKKDGIRSRDKLLSFIRKEDFLFRTFLAHLSEMDNEPLSDITHLTDEVCQGIFKAAREGSLPSQDVVVYMSMRTSRRLLQNSAECVKGMSRLNIRNKTQANAYLWMIIQPFISIDQLSLATMTEHDRSTFSHIAKQLPQSRKFAENFGVNIKDLNYLLPQQLLKLYVSSL